MSSTAIEDVVDRIRRLTAEERAELARRLSPILSQEYSNAVEVLSDSARRDGITEEDIDNAVARVRYGK
jgi:hypothetical protein